MQINAMQCQAMKSIAKPYRAMASNTKPCKAIQSHAKQRRAMQSNAKHFDRALRGQSHGMTAVRIKLFASKLQITKKARRPSDFT